MKQTPDNFQSFKQARIHINALCSELVDDRTLTAKERQKIIEKHRKKFEFIPVLKQKVHNLKLNAFQFGSKTNLSGNFPSHEQITAKSDTKQLLACQMSNFESIGLSMVTGNFEGSSKNEIVCDADE